MEHRMRVAAADRYVHILGITSPDKTQMNNFVNLALILGGTAAGIPALMAASVATAGAIGNRFPAIRQVGQTIFNANPNLKYVMPIPYLLTQAGDKTQTNSDFSDSYLENLSQLGQVAFRQHVRKHSYPKPSETISLPLNPSVYKEINPSGKYANFADILGMANAAIGGDRQVEYTDGGMSGSGYIDKNGNFVWNLSDKTSWEFDPG